LIGMGIPAAAARKPSRMRGSPRIRRPSRAVSMDKPFGNGAPLLAICCSVLLISDISSLPCREAVTIGFAQRVVACIQFVERLIDTRLINQRRPRGIAAGRQIGDHLSAAQDAWQRFTEVSACTGESDTGK